MADVQQCGRILDSEGFGRREGSFDPLGKLAVLYLSPATHRIFHLGNKDRLHEATTRVARTCDVLLFTPILHGEENAHSSGDVHFFHGERLDPIEELGDKLACPVVLLPHKETQSTLECQRTP